MKKKQPEMGVVGGAPPEDQQGSAAMEPDEDEWTTVVINGQDLLLENAGWEKGAWMTDWKVRSSRAPYPAYFRCLPPSRGKIDHTPERMLNRSTKDELEQTRDEGSRVEQEQNENGCESCHF